MNNIPYNQFKESFPEAITHKSDFAYFAYYEGLQVKWDRGCGCGDVYLNGELFHDGCSLEQCKRYVKLMEDTNETL